MKKIALISTFCNTPEKVEVLRNTLIQLKELGVDSAMLTSLEIPFDVISLATYCFTTKENPRIKWPEYARISKKSFFENGTSFTLVTGLADYGFAHAWQYKKLSQIALTYDYEIFYLVNYDLNFDERVIDALRSNEIVCSIWAHTRGDFSANATLNFACFNRENILRFGEIVTREQYVSHLAQTHDSTEHWFEKLYLGIDQVKFEDHQITDLIAEGGSTDIYDISQIKSVKIFVQKCNLDRFDVNLLVYSFSEEKNIRVITNLGEHGYSGKGPCLFTLALDSDDLLKTVVIEVDGESQELLPQIRSIDINQIFI